MRTSSRTTLVAGAACALAACGAAGDKVVEDVGVAGLEVGERVQDVAEETAGDIDRAADDVGGDPEPDEGFQYARRCGDERDVCEPSEYCDFETASPCGRGGASGFCRSRPEVCTQNHDPVCGCDGVTHPNECAAHAAGTDVAGAGPCP